MDSETEVVRQFSQSSRSSSLNVFENLQENLLKQIDLFPPRNTDLAGPGKGEPWESTFLTSSEVLLVDGLNFKHHSLWPCRHMGDEREKPVKLEQQDEIILFLNYFKNLNYKVIQTYKNYKHTVKASKI